ICDDKDNYRFGYNGKEKDNEGKGLGNSQNYGLRIYDTRLAKFLSVDPLTREFPSLSTYHFAANNPIRFIDLDGGEPKDYLPGRFYLSDVAVRLADAIELNKSFGTANTFNSAQINNIRNYVRDNAAKRNSSSFSSYENAN